MSVKTISPQELNKLMQNGSCEVIDVRTPAEFQEIHATVATNIPLDRLSPKDVMEARNGSAGNPLYVICKSGNRAGKACDKFIAAGYDNVVNIEGGTQAWADAGLPVVRGKKVMSLERQVRITAGFLVLVGALLGMFVHPYFAGLSAFVGAGLMFAGITDTCGMAMLLAKMPWNQATGCSNSCSK
ncbi:DUF2892 domain-containing protein [bacterium]|nr:DUF2892 domain-containing protein [bacterium]